VARKVVTLARITEYRTGNHAIQRDAREIAANGNWFFMYSADLALIHDRWYDAFPRAAAAHVQSHLAGLKAQAILDLGCGSGVLLEQLAPLGVSLHGIDISTAMIERCRARLPHADFQVKDVLKAEIPTADVIVMVGEILSYAAAAHRADERMLLRFFQRIFQALSVKGIFLFDVLGNAHDYSGKYFQDREDFFVLSDVSQQGELVHRHIISFLQEHDVYKKSVEDHSLLTFSVNQMQSLLEQAGFSVKQIFHYDVLAMLPGRIAFECSKH